MVKANTIIEIGLMASKDSHSLLLSGYNETTDIENGALCVRGAGVAGNPSTYKVTAPVDITSDALYIAEAPVEIKVAGMKIGLNDHTLFINEKKRPFRLRKLVVGDTFKLSTDGFKTAPTVGQYVIGENGGFKLVPSETAVAGTISTFLGQVDSAIKLDNGGKAKVDGFKIVVIRA